MASPRKHIQAMWKHLESGASKPRISETAASLGPVIRAFRHHSMFGLSPLGLIACIISSSSPACTISPSQVSSSS